MMGSKVTFKVDWDDDPEKKSGLCVRQISCGDAEDIPAPVYMAILKALMEAEYILNGDESPKEEAEPVRIRGPVEPSDLPPPPPHAENRSKEVGQQIQAILSGRENRDSGNVFRRTFSK